MRRAISGGLHLFKWKNIIIKTVEYNKGNGIMSKEKKFVCEKNDELELDITDLGSTGEGIGKIDGYTLFVKDALIGDKVRVKVIKTKKNYGYARLLEIIKPSEFRVEPECPVARQCGGCQLQHCSYEKQLSWKEEKVANCLRRIGGVPVYTEEEYKKIAARRSYGSKSVEKRPDKEECKNILHQEETKKANKYDRAKTENNVDNTLNGTPIIMESILRMEKPVHYRNKAQFPVGYDKDGNLVAGFYAGRTHSIIPQTDCLIQHECNKQIVETVLEFMKKYKVTAYDEKKNKGIVRHILTRVGKTTGEVMVCLVINAKKLPHPEEFVEMIRNCGINLEIKSITVNINREKTNVILGEKIETLYGHSYIEDYIGDIKYRISPLSFYQVNPEQTKKLYQTALEFADIKESEVVWDLYCGIGTISLFMAQTAAKVCGVEIVPQAIEDAKQNAELNHMINTEFFVGAAEDVVPKQYEKSGGKLRADVVTLDPPRKGCDEKLLETVVKMAPSRIVYVSCDPGTLARDVKVLVERGYEVKRVRACDMFGGSFHVETVVLLSQQKPDDTIEIDLDLDELDATSAETKATYQEIKDCVLKEFGLKVSNLYIYQIKRKCGIEVGENYNLPKTENPKVPQCPKEKEDAIKATLKYFAMI